MSARDPLPPIVDWILTEGRCQRMGPFFAGFCQRLRAAGMPLFRSTLHIRQLHPQFFARAFAWHHGEAVAVESPREHGIEKTAMYLDSPLHRVYEFGETVRRRLEDPATPDDFPILADLRREGATDYAVLGMPFRRGTGQAITLASDRPGGFGDEHLTIVKALLPAFSTVVELINQERMTETLLATYVGQSTGRLVLAGKIRRGDLQRIRAVLWYCDLRRFTELSETQDPEALLAMLNDFFQAMASPVAAAGGEILKFIGDAMLAIIPVEEGDPAGATKACAAALAAAAEARAEIGRLNRMRTAAGRTPFDFGLALHIGDVLYGNIGAQDRLDFTVIGPAVNLVSRIEHLCADLDRPLVVSAEFAALAGQPMRSLGQHALRGIREAHEIFALA